MSKKEKKKTVLVVDDKKDIRDLVREGLDNVYNVIEADNGKTALDVLEDNDVDVIILDVLMPRMSGVDVVNKLEKQDKERVMLLTVLDKEGIDEQYPHMRDVPYVQKPISVTKLREHVKRLVAG
jgi:response regulator RpfG family c-di-GMP phosphodiesterase